MKIGEYLERVVEKFKYVEEEKFVIACEGRFGKSEIEINQSTRITSHFQDLIQGEGHTQSDQTESREQTLQDLVRRLHSESKEHASVVEQLEDRIQSLQSDRDVGMERITTLEKEIKDMKNEIGEARAEMEDMKAELQQNKESLAETKKDVRNYEALSEGTPIDFVLTWPQLTQQQISGLT